MSIAFSCPFCGKGFEVSASLAGKRGKCKDCGEVFVIPDSGRGNSSPVVGTTARRPARSEQGAAFDPYQVDDDGGVKQQPLDNGSDHGGFADDGLPPRAAGKPKKKKRRSGAGEEDIVDRALGIAMLGSVGVSGFLCLVAFVWSPANVVFLVGTWVIALFLLFVGWLAAMMVCAREGIACALMFAFVPFYELYQHVTRWDAMRKSFWTRVLGAGLCAGSFLLASIFAIMHGHAQVDNLRDTNALAADALEGQVPGALSRSERYEAHAKVVRAQIALATELAERLTEIHDVPTAQAAASRLRELGDLERRLEARARELPALGGYGSFCLTLEYRSAVSNGTAADRYQVARLNEIPGVRETVNSAYGPGLGSTQPLLVHQPAPRAGNPAHGGGDPFPPGRGAPLPGRQMAPPAPKDCLTIRIIGITDAADVKVIENRLRAIYQELSTSPPTTTIMTGSGNERTFLLAPPVNTEEFVSRIDFGKAQQTWQTRITVTLGATDGGPLREKNGLAARPRLDDSPRRPGREMASAEPLPAREGFSVEPARAPTPAPSEPSPATPAAPAPVDGFGPKPEAANPFAKPATEKPAPDEDPPANGFAVKPKQENPFVRPRAAMAQEDDEPPPANGFAVKPKTRRDDGEQPDSGPFRRKERGSSENSAGEGIPTLITQLGSPEAGAKNDALRTLKEMPPTTERRDVAKAVQTLLRDPDTSIRLAAAGVLAAWGGAENVHALVATLGDRETAVRRQVLDALKAIRAPASAEAVAALVPGTDRLKACETLKAIGPAAEDAVIPYLQDKNTFVRTDACNVLREIGTEKCVAALTAIASKKRGTDATAASEALARIARRGVNVKP